MTRSSENALLYGGGALILFGAYLWWKKNRQASEAVLSPLTPAPMPQASLPAPPPPPAPQEAPLPAIWAYRQSVTEPFSIGYDNGTVGGQGVGYNYLIGIRNPFARLVTAVPLLSLPYAARNSVGDSSAIEMAQGAPLAKMREMVRNYLASRQAGT